MAGKTEERDVYFIPPNFLTGGRLFGGSIRMRNAIEAGILVLCTGIPLFRSSFPLMTRIILLCLITLPLGILGIAGFEGVSLSEFAMNWVKWLSHRRILYSTDTEPDIRIRTARRKPVPRTSQTQRHAPPQNLGIKVKTRESRLSLRLQRVMKESSSEHSNSDSKVRKKAPQTADDFIPVKDIRNGIVETTDGRYVKILEVEPINFLLRSAREQKNIILSFGSWLKISPVKVQMKVLTKKADIGKHLRAIERDMEAETNEKCRELQQDYYHLIQTIGSREAITRRFLLIFEYEAVNNRKTEYTEIISALETAAQTAKQYLLHCDNAIVSHDDEDAFLAEILYTVFQRSTSEIKPLEDRIREIRAASEDGQRPFRLGKALAPESVDLTHGSYVIMDGVYHAYLMVPSDGYNSKVTAGWTSLLVNAGEGIDVDFFFEREPKERIQAKLGQQIRINRSRIKDASDTNTDFDDFEGAIQSGYFLKEGLANYEDFYYMNTLVTVTADTLENLEWRIAELQRLAVSQDMDLRLCRFNQEQALMSILPLCRIDKRIFEGSKRNLLTSAAASSYPFTSYEMSDENGILLGVNQHNNSLVIVDIFNSRTYKNANMVLLGTSGAGKTFTLQLIALRMRRKGTQVFIIAPLKGHEFLRACRNIGGEYISISPGSRQCINIMQIRKQDLTANEIIDGVANDNSILARKIQQLHIFFSLLIPDITHEERQLLDEALIKAYAKKGITHSNDSLIDPEHPDQYREMPLLGDVHEILMEGPDTRRMGNILNRLVNGSARTFNQQTNVNLNNLYTVLDISELTGELLPVGMFVALDYVWDKAKEDRTKEKAIFIDEAWELIGADEANSASPTSSGKALAGEWVQEIFKTIRGYGGAAVAATQDIGDLDRSRTGKGILNVAKTKIILNLEDDEARRVQDNLHLTDAEITSITRFERGHGLISTNSNHITVAFQSSPLEKQLITTDRLELTQIVSERTKQSAHNAEQ